ncbi:hypothetical protein KOR42_19750 [Thalassoglobus neptunius]|uniref:Carboxypeptidase regulatory-like domain-containing protein n=1 Tax=Thalassoglobus neptunius TaxID=1938619 RepID=A0A5C5X8I0_9PLAN|nr:carboxypeptidase-like regulatory domain-containing protein [Thalassoglobus neptunius]TWT58593.1 hypothetical protein KOR42_19750 [Thalassoglobus neptunius]
MRNLISLCGIVAISAMGCGPSGPDIEGVHGKVTMNGQPLRNASIVFMPVESGRPAGARTDEEGMYVLNFSGGRQGAQAGEYKVRISTASDPMAQEDGSTTPGSPETVPLKYGAQTTLTATVVEGGDNEFNFDITSEGPVAQAEDGY